MLRGLIALALIAAVCSGLLYGVRVWTAPHIEANRAEARNKVFADMLTTPPGALVENDQGMLGACADGWLGFTVTTPGYAGDIEMAALWRADALSMRAVRHLETPDIGDFIDGEWLQAKDGYDEPAWQNIDTVSGATITTQAVRRLAQNAFVRGLEVCRAE